MKVLVYFRRPAVILCEGAEKGIGGYQEWVQQRSGQRIGVVENRMAGCREKWAENGMERIDAA